MCKTQEDFITKEFRKRLEDIFPSLRKELFVLVYSKRQESVEWHLENREVSMMAAFDERILMQYEDPEEVFDSRSEEWGKKKKIRWEIRMTENLKTIISGVNTPPDLELAPVKYFFEMILKRMSIGLMDCSMFDRIKTGDETAIAHLFGEIPKMSSLLSDCVDEIMEKNDLPNPTVITHLSAQMYEKRPVHGSLLFLSEEKWQELQVSEEDFLSLEEVKQEQRKLEITNMRSFRKMIEMNSNEISAVVISKKNASAVSEKSWQLMGLVFNQAVQDADVFWIDFKGTLTWSIRKNNKIWFTYKNGSYKQRIEEYLELDYREKVNIHAHEYAGQMLSIIELLQKEKHGTSIVFFKNTEHLQNELKRFHEKNRCIKLAENGVELKACLEKMKGITAIDGALLADYSGRCYAIGVIFDGEAVIEGLVSRGARFNSISNYVQLMKERYKTNEIIGVIVSEDESVDVRIPES